MFGNALRPAVDALDHDIFQHPAADCGDGARGTNLALELAIGIELVDRDLAGQFAQFERTDVHELVL